MFGTLLLGALIGTALCDNSESASHCRNCGSNDSTTKSCGGRTKYTCRHCGRWWYK